MNYRKRILCAITLCGIPLLGGCALLDDPLNTEDSYSIYEEESTTTATTTQTEFTFTFTSRTTAPESRNTEPQTALTETTGAPDAETTAPPEATSAQTEQTTGTDLTESALTTTAVTVPQGELRYQLSGLAAVRILIAKNPLQYCTEENGSTVFDLQKAAEAAGMRRQGDGYASGGAALQTGAVLDPTVSLGRHTDAPILQEIRYTAGGEEIIIDQQAPYKADYCLPDGTCITKDQMMLLSYLAEHLAADPDTDPLADVIPARFSGTNHGNLCYYIP